MWFKKTKNPTYDIYLTGSCSQVCYNCCGEGNRKESIVKQAQQLIEGGSNWGDSDAPYCRVEPLSFLTLAETDQEEGEGEAAR